MNFPTPHHTQNHIPPSPPHINFPHRCHPESARPRRPPPRGRGARRRKDSRTPRQRTQQTPRPHRPRRRPSQPTKPRRSPRVPRTRRRAQRRRPTKILRGVFSHTHTHTLHRAPHSDSEVEGNLFDSAKTLSQAKNLLSQRKMKSFIFGRNPHACSRPLGLDDVVAPRNSTARKNNNNNNKRQNIWGPVMTSAVSGGRRLSWCVFWSVSLDRRTPCHRMCATHCAVSGSSCNGFSQMRSWGRGPQRYLQS